MGRRAPAPRVAEGPAPDSDAVGGPVRHRQQDHLAGRERAVCDLGGSGGALGASS